MAVSNQGSLDKKEDDSGSDKKDSGGSQTQQEAMEQTQANVALISAGYTPTATGWVSSGGSNVGKTPQAVKNLEATQAANLADRNVISLSAGYGGAEVPSSLVAKYGEMKGFREQRAAEVIKGAPLQEGSMGKTGSDVVYPAKTFSPLSSERLSQTEKTGGSLFLSSGELPAQTERNVGGLPTYDIPKVGGSNVVTATTGRTLASSPDAAPKKKFEAEGKGIFGGMSNVGGGETVFASRAPIMSVEPSKSQYGSESYFKAEQGEKVAVVYSPKDAYTQIGAGKSTSLEIDRANAISTARERAAANAPGVIGGLSLVGGGFAQLKQQEQPQEPKRISKFILEPSVNAGANKAFREAVSGFAGYGAERALSLYEIIAPPVKYIPKSANVPLIGEVSPKSVVAGAVSGAMLISPFGQGEVIATGVGGTSRQKTELTYEIVTIAALGSVGGKVFGIGAKMQPEFTASSTGFLQPTAKLIAEKPLGAGGILKETPTRLTMTTKNVGSGVEVKVGAQQGLVSSTQTATVPKEFIGLTSSDASYSRIVRGLKPETQFTYPRSVTTPFNVEISTPGGGVMKVPGTFVETQISSTSKLQPFEKSVAVGKTSKLQPFEKSVAVGKGGIEPTGKARVASIKEYYLGETKVGARTNVETFYTGLATEVKTPLGKGYEIASYKKTSGGEFKLLPGGGKVVMKQPSAEFAGNVLIERKTSAKGFMQESPAIKQQLDTLGVQTRVSGKYVGEGNVEIDVSGAKFLYPERVALGEKGTVSGFRVVGKLGEASMDSFSITKTPPTPKTVPKNVGDISTISFKEEVINPKKSQEFFGAEVVPAPSSTLERRLTVQEMGGVSVGAPRPVATQIQAERPVQIFKEAEIERGMFGAYQSVTKPKLMVSERTAERTLPLFLPSLSARQSSEQIQIKLERTYTSAAEKTATYQLGTEKTFGVVSPLQATKSISMEKTMQTTAQLERTMTAVPKPEIGFTPILPPPPSTSGGFPGLEPPSVPGRALGGLFIPGFVEEGGKGKKFKVKQNLKDLLSIDIGLRKKGF